MRINTFVRLSVAGALLVGAAATAPAQSSDRRTFFEFSGPVAVPGVTLPAGKYMFRVATTTQREVLQVLSADGSVSYAQFFALRANRTESTPRPEVRFMETGPGVPAAIDTWWHPSELVGYEFIYPKGQADRLAAGMPAPPVVGAPVVTERAAAAPAPVLVIPPPVIGEFAPETIPVVEPAPLARLELPRTASPTMLIAFAGVILLFGTALLGGVRLARR